MFHFSSNTSLIDAVPWDDIKELDEEMDYDHGIDYDFPETFSPSQESPSGSIGSPYFDAHNSSLLPSPNQAASSGSSLLSSTN